MRYLFLIILTILQVVFFGGCVNNNPAGTTNPSLTETLEDSGVPAFNLQDYQNYLEYGKANNLSINVGAISSRDQAQEKAKQVWSKYMQYEDFGGKDLQISYDATTNTWLAILTIIPENIDISPEGSWPTLDCEPCVIFNTNGDVLAMWTQ